ncbi:UDP-2,3-diacylglucosamine hydrolase [Sulfurimonas sp. HSL1-6]|uniref:UDP-2,3-diacylglucosamine diphosphatase n=1 Tax=Thiomicrolovo immobilis TaxID=3131935 RepID=UPI0031F792E6
MSRDPYEILPGALLISDAHYSATRPQLLSLLLAVDAGTVKVPQLLLMGDIFDLLFGQIKVTHAMNAEAVAVLQRISRRIPVLYLEGNHDYNLAALFPEATVVPLSYQPFACRCADRAVLLAHGDFNQPLSYRIYTALIRNGAVLRLLGVINRLTGNGIIAKLEAYLERKNHCHTMAGFETFVRAHLAPLALADVDIFIEGHYHQGKRFDVDGVRYFNPAAFACNLRYAIVRNEQNGFTLQAQEWNEG